MGVYEESKERLVGLQNKVQRVYDAGEALTKDQSKTARSKFKIMYASLESIANDFETHLTVVIRQQCKGGASGPDGIDTEKERAAFEEKYIGCKILADEHLPESIAEASLNQTFMEKKVPQINIPVEKLPVPHFSGDQKEYTSFRNQFDVLVHNNEVFRPVIQFSYLKAYLEGESLKLINNLMLSDENYELALNILDKRYSNRRTIAHDHFDQLWTAQKAMLGDSKSIRQLLNTITESVGALKTQRYAVDQWDPILLYLFQKKLDAPLRGQWELLVDTNDDPTVEDFLTFLTKFCKAAGAGQSSASGREKVSTTKPDKITTLHTTQSKFKKPKPMYANANEQKKSFSCQVCKVTPGHLFICCPDFKQKSPAERHQLIKDLNRCYLCFSEHMSMNCKSTRVCEVCGGRHHSWLHLDNNAVEDQSNTLLSSVGNLPIRSQVLMSTVEILIQDANGCYQRARALLDSASESSYMTESCRYRLGVSRQKCHLAVSGISGVKVPTIKARAQVVIRPVRHHEPQMTIEAYVVTQITGCTPSKHIRNADWVHLKDLELADPNFNEPLPVDVLLGAEVFPYIIRSGRRENLLSEPVGIETVFGWALMGNTGNTNPKRSTTLLTSLDSVDLVLRRFWEIEEVPNASKTSPAEEDCERIYHSTTTREADGRYVVNLPFNCKPPQLGQSRQMALNRLYRLESRLDKLPQLRQQYNTAMQDYLDSGHMQIVPEATPEPEQAYYTPHQVVIKPDSTTTKVRVVYDASATTSNGKSLNDNLYPGKKLQQDLPGIIIRFRVHEVVVTADIKQMFRQIIVTPAHRQYQRLLYRFQSSEPIQTFEMTTVTFGQRSSPFLAIRTLLQLASDEAGGYSDVQRVLCNDLYVDDVVTGADCVESALQLQQNLIKILKKGQFELRKWSSNSAKVLDALPKEHRQNQDVAFNGGEIEFTKVLGLKWEPNSDVLTYQHQTNPIQFSKRHILSEIARIYDPIGLLAPVTTHLKKLMKYLWSLGVG